MKENFTHDTHPNNEPRKLSLSEKIKNKIVKYKFIIFTVLILFLGLSAAKIASPNWVEDLHDKYNGKDEFIAYWYNSDAMLNYQNIKQVPQEVIIAKMWLETKGSLSGAGRRGAIFGIKGDGVKGYDNVDKENVEYQGYTQAWQAISHFCDLINNDPILLANGVDKVNRALYYRRYLAWKQSKRDYPDWQCWLLALQVHPERSQSKLSYAACGCKDGTQKWCYNKRLKHSLKGIDWVNNNLKFDVKD